MPDNFYIDVPGDLQAWTVGPIIAPGFSVRIQASGDVQFRAVPSVEYSQPEGAYGPTYPAGHPYNPPAVDPPVVVVPPVISSGTPPLSLVLAVLPDGGGLPSLTGNLTNALCPQRDTTYQYSDFVALGLISQGQTGRLFFCYNDQLGRFGDNAGQFSIIITRTASGGNNMRLQRANPRATQRLQIGVQTVVGTPVPALLDFRSLSKFVPKRNVETEAVHTEGSKRPFDVLTNRQIFDASVEYRHDYNEIDKVLSNQCCQPIITPYVAGVYQKSFQSSTKTADPHDRWTLQHGSEVRGAQTSDVTLTDLMFKSDRKQVTGSLKMFGGPFAAAPSEIITLHVAGTPTGGTFDLNFLIDCGPDSGALGRILTVAGFLFNTTAAQAQVLIDAVLGTDGHGLSNCVVSGGPQPGTDLVFTFKEELGQCRVQMQFVTHLTGGAPVITITETVIGGMTPATSEIQVWTVNGVPTGGTIAASLNGSAPSATWAYNDTAANVQTALNNLLGAGSVTVTGVAGGPWTVTYAWRYGLKRLQDVVFINGLTGGVTPTITMAESQLGGLTRDPWVPMTAGDTMIFFDTKPLTFDPNEGTLANELTRFLQAADISYQLTGRRGQVWSQDGGSGPSDESELEAKETIDVTIYYNAEGDDPYEWITAGTKMYCRILSMSGGIGNTNGTGVQIGNTGIYYGRWLDACVKVMSVGDFGDVNGKSCWKYTLQVLDDDLLGCAYRVVTQNGKAAA